MFIKKIFIFIPQFLLLLLIQVNATPTKDIYEWDVAELSFESSLSSHNPYMNIQADKPSLLVVVFRNNNQSFTKEIRISGFWDGGKTWKVRFAPPVEGEWYWKSESVDPAMNGQSGHFNCLAYPEKDKKANPTRHGFIYVNKQSPGAGRYFVYADGTPFLWIGDTWWNWTKKNITLGSFKKLADDRASKGFTIGQLFFAGNGWTEQSSLLDSTYNHPDLEAIHRAESFIRYANKKGITVWIHPWWMRRDMAEKISREQIERWWIYTINRLGAYNVIWVLAGEYNMFDYGGYGQEFINKLGTLVKRNDPYKRIVSMHNTPPGWGGGDDAPQWSTADIFHNQTWLDYNQSQPGHGKWRNMMVPVIVKDAYQKTPPKPIVITETWYEFIEGDAPAWDIRYGAWSAILSGAAGHTYGGGHVWRAYLPESFQKHNDPWPLDTTFSNNTLNYPGARSISFMAHFLQKMEWWKMEPHSELISGNPSSFCSAIPDKLYLIYLPYGGSVKVNLQLLPSSRVNYEWYDLTTSKKVNTGVKDNTSVCMFQPPEDYPGILGTKDYLLVIRINN